MPFPKFEDFATVWVEKTKSSHGQGGKGLKITIGERVYGKKDEEQF